ncbi:acyl-CoA dehydrogenase family protein [Marimonas lutisalis]|uniref:acyl-CoA dehydrogenase family protein n=1 Tax=Marimonas lutisalis TaxID=2545756 RepID=UPI0010F47315|nr:acyl-CoA dehydrogenase family protein [Marimonas lutisalis]
MSDNLDDFRTEIAAWIADNLPAELKGIPRDENTICWGGRNWQFASDAQKQWLERCHARGLTCPRWPTEYGGGGLSRAQEKIFREEMLKAEAPSPLESFGIWMLGPALLKFGTDEQKAAHLPDITAGKIRWCQGYSEPGAGSDLANVQTRAEDMGDHWLINGQKIWTSYADKADKIFALVRTDRDAPKHLGISFMLIDMETPGVTTKPIRLISGASPFCETFFDNVKVPKEGAIVGEQNRGWDVAKYLLTHEREMIGGGGGGLMSGSTLSDMIGTMDPAATADPVLRAEAMELEVDAMAFALTMERYKDMAESGAGVGNASAMLKYYGTELNKRRHEIIMSAKGSDALDWGHGAAAPWLRTKANSIEGGTSEVMLDIISKRVLELPSK